MNDKCHLPIMEFLSESGCAKSIEQGYFYGLGFLDSADSSGAAALLSQKQRQQYQTPAKVNIKVAQYIIKIEGKIPKSVEVSVCPKCRKAKRAKKYCMRNCLAGPIKHAALENCLAAETNISSSFFDWTLPFKLFSDSVDIFEIPKLEYFKHWFLNDGGAEPQTLLDWFTSGDKELFDNLMFNMDFTDAQQQHCSKKGAAVTLKRKRGAEEVMRGEQKKYRKQ